MTERTPGPWDFACDSYGKVRHSRKACIYANVMMPGGQRSVHIAKAVENWTDAKLICTAVNSHESLVQLVERALGILDPNTKWTARETARSWEAWKSEARAALGEMREAA